MRILIVNKFLYPRGGSETYIKTLADGLIKHGHEVSFFGIADKKNTMTNEYGIYVTPSDFRTKNPLKAAKYPFRLIYSFEAKAKMKEIIEKFRPDIIHINNFNFHLTPSILDVIPANIPVVMTAHDAQLMCPNHLMYIPSIGKTCQECLKQGNTAPCFKNRCTHGSTVKSLLSALEGTIYRNVDTYRRIDRIICPSMFLKDLYNADKRFTGKTIFLQNSVTPRVRPDDVTQKDYVLYFGRMSKEKGVGNILDAAKAFPDVKFVLAGSTDNSEVSKEILSMSENKQLGNIVYVGFKSGEELDRLIAEAKLVILPSICYENCPLAVIEAQQLGSAVLVPDYGGAAEMTDGPRIENESSAALVNALRTILNDEKVLETMREDSRKRGPKYPDTEEYVRSVEDLYKKEIIIRSVAK